MSNYIKKYNIGNLKIDLPYNSVIHELPLLSFSTFRNSINISLVYNKELEIKNDDFDIKEGFKLNVQKRIILDDNVPKEFIDSNGKYINLISNTNLNSTNNNGIYTFNDESKRVLRSLPNQFEIEYEDLSRELYNSLGNIIAIYDKYGDIYLSFIYDNNNLLEKIICNGKEVILSYNSYINKIESISYGGTTTIIYYDIEDLIIEHYSGVDYYITVAEDSYIVSGRGIEGSKLVIINKECKFDENKIILEDKENNEIVDRTTYYFTENVTTGRKRFSKVEIEYINGLKQRVEYIWDKPLYSYEILDDVLFDEYNNCINDVHIYNTLTKDMNYVYDEENSFQQEVRNLSYIGDFKYYNGARMQKVNDTCYQMDLINYNYENFRGRYLLTGWIQIKNNYYSSEISIRNNLSGDQICKFDFPNKENGKYHFFAYEFDTDSNNIYVMADEKCLSFKDLRITYQPMEIIDDNLKNHTLYKEEVLIHKVDYSYILPLADIKFSYVIGNEESDEIKLNLNDLLRYIKRNIKFSDSSELYYNNGKNAINNLTELKIKYYTTYLSLEDYILGYRYYSDKYEFLIKIEESNNNSEKFIIKKIINGQEYSSDCLNEYFDVVKHEEDGKIIQYIRDKGLLIREKAQVNEQLEDNPELRKLYNYLYSYDNVNNKITVKDEFEAENNILTEGVVYYVDSIWGTVYKVQYGDDLEIIDTYDNDMSTLLQKKFQKLNSNITHSYGYSNGKISSLSCGGLEYSFNSNKGFLSEVAKCGLNIVEENHSPMVSEFYYPDSENEVYRKQYNFDSHNRLINMKDGLGNIQEQYSYELLNIMNSPTVNPPSGAKLVMSEDEVNGCKNNFTYDYNEMLSEIETVESANPSNVISKESFTYDDVKRIINKKYIYDVAEQEQNSLYVQDEYEYMNTDDSAIPDNRIKSTKYTIKNAASVVTNYFYDSSKRLNKKEYVFNRMSCVKELEYAYNKICYESSTVKGDLKRSSTISYDKFNRIASMTIDNKTITYEYDIYGRLIRENNQPLDKTIIYGYNEFGNIIENKTYSYTLNINPTNLLSSKTYSYDTNNKDRLVNYNGNLMLYNSLGCPTTLNDYSLLWSKGKLIGLTKGTLQTGTENYTYSYNSKGQRISKTYSRLAGTGAFSTIAIGEVIGYNKKYNYDSFGRLINEIGTVTYYNQGTFNEAIHYYYDGNQVVAMRYNHNSTTSTYYFDRNIYGDVVGIYDFGGNLKVKYIYDAYGNCTISNDTTDTILARINPFRYRGYYYDVETSLFWLSSRYYSPELCRFISPDDVEYLDPESVNGLNLYCYCMNNPIMYADPSGCFPVLACILGLTALVGMGLTIGGVASDNNLMTAIGLTMVAIPALISGGMALYCAGAAGTMAIGGITAVAGLGTGLFASAEYQEAFTGNNWMLDAGMSEEWYNGLMLATAAIATAGTVASMAGVTRYQKFGNSNWHGGWRKMRSHYLKHGRPEMGYRSVFDYTNGANAIVNNGGVYLSNANSYAQWIAGNKYLYVGVGRGSNLITTYSIRTIKYVKYLSML